MSSMLLARTARAGASSCYRSSCLVSASRTRALPIGRVSWITPEQHTHAYSTLLSTVDSDRWEKRLDQQQQQQQHPQNYQRQQQVRHMGRKSGASAFSKPRPPTRKQRKTFHRRRRELEHAKTGKHSAQGSKAGVRREWVQNQKEDMLELAATGERPPITGNLDYETSDAILDDMVGNTSHLTSQPNPRPSYLGHKFDRYDRIMTHQMGTYRLALDADSSKAPEDVEALSPESSAVSTAAAALPTDKLISLLLRSYRDKTSTRSRRIGIAPALQLLLQEYKIPSAAFGEQTYTTLLTCSNTPVEAKRIFRLMSDASHPISSYSFSILVDVYARKGDFRGCIQAMDEMSREHNMQPPLAAYTSLLAACFKICNSASAPQKLKAEAGHVAWEKWKEMRVIGIDADVMAYGAILRIFQARGLPERAMSILDEMQTMNVKPTTLCFTSALRAVARSHANALRFEHGTSRKNKRRETIAAHHGRMTRQILMLAENAEIRQDKGYVSALILCAATAGDSATAKAIYLASQVRATLRHKLMFGDNDHHKQLRGEEPRKIENTSNDTPLHLEHGGDVDASASTSTMDASVDESQMMMRQEEGGDGPIQELDTPKEKRVRYPSFQEREYGKDTRIFSALLGACSKAMEGGGLGDMWAGRHNKGYLDEASLNFVEKRKKPNYVNTSIPGMTSMEVGVGSMTWDEETEEKDPFSKKLRMPKFRGMNQDDSLGNTLDDLPEEYQEMFKADPYFKMPYEDDDNAINDTKTIAAGKALDPLAALDGSTAFYDAKTGKVVTGDSLSPISLPAETENVETYDSDDEDEDEYISDDDSVTVEQGTSNITLASDKKERDYEKFFLELQKDMKEIGEEVDEEEAREMFEMFGYQGNDSVEKEDNYESDDESSTPETFEEFYASMKEDDDADEMDETQARELFNMIQGLDSIDSEDSTDGNDSSNLNDATIFDSSGGMDNNITISGDDASNEKMFGNMSSEFSNMTNESSNNKKLSASTDVTNVGFEANPMDITGGQGRHETAMSSTNRNTPGSFEVFYEEMRSQFEADGMTKGEAREMYHALNGNSSSSNVRLKDDTIKKILPDTFEEFYREMKVEIEEDGIDEDEAREIFLSFKSDNPEPMGDGANSMFPKSMLPDTFEEFYGDMKEEFAADGMSKADAKELFEMVKGKQPEESEEVKESENTEIDILSKRQDTYEDADWRDILKPEHGQTTTGTKGYEERMSKLLDDYESEISLNPSTVGEARPETEGLRQLQPIKEEQRTSTQYTLTRELEQNQSNATIMEMPTNNNMNQYSPRMDAASSFEEREGDVVREPTGDMSEWEEVDEFDLAVPGLPAKRVQKLREVFMKSMGEPSMLHLVPVLRENMPDNLNHKWLKWKNMQNAEFVMAKARESGSVDMHTLNNMLQVECSFGSLNRALAFYHDEFKRNGIQHTTQSDRLVIQMFLKNGRMARAVAFKDMIESQGRKLDLISYGSLIEYYANRKHLGSSLMLLKECINEHGSPPGEKSLKKLRQHCRLEEIDRKVGLQELIGEDPLEWLRHGEENLKREMSYKGRRNVTFARNRLVRI